MSTFWSQCFLSLDYLFWTHMRVHTALHFYSRGLLVGQRCPCCGRSLPRKELTISSDSIMCWQKCPSTVIKPWNQCKRSRHQAASWCPFQTPAWASHILHIPVQLLIVAQKAVLISQLGCHGNIYCLLFSSFGAAMGKSSHSPPPSLQTRLPALQPLIPCWLRSSDRRYLVVSVLLYIPFSV